jgi:8-oxo-dGTP pyrophosphatase MutT (NUDIX family)
MARIAWKPAVTVAAVIERDGRFLLIEERDGSSLVLNQPAGHWEEGETLPAACVRETLEESAYEFNPTALVGIYRWRPPASDTTYLRFAFAGRVGEQLPNRTLDEGIVRAVWLSLDELRASLARHRSPLVLRCVEDYLAGNRFPMDILTHFE